MESSRTRKMPRLERECGLLSEMPGDPDPRPMVCTAPPPASRGDVSPPWRDDDRDGHYVFYLWENLTLLFVSR